MSAPVDERAAAVATWDTVGSVSSPEGVRNIALPGKALRAEQTHQFAAKMQDCGGPWRFHGSTIVTRILGPCSGPPIVTIRSLSVLRWPGGAKLDAVNFENAVLAKGIYSEASSPETIKHDINPGRREIDLLNRTWAHGPVLDATPSTQKLRQVLAVKTWCCCVGPWHSLARRSVRGEQLQLDSTIRRNVLANAAGHDSCSAESSALKWSSILTATRVVTKHTTRKRKCEWSAPVRWLMPPCRACQQPAARRNGRGRRGRQKYACSLCCRTFTENTTSAFSGYRWPPNVIADSGALVLFVPIVEPAGPRAAGRAGRRCLAPHHPDVRPSVWALARR